ERVYTGNRIEGSIPSLSAFSLFKTLKLLFFYCQVCQPINLAFFPWLVPIDVIPHKILCNSDHHRLAFET
ncbi:MAG: hypothetical protein RLN85_17410, partial [Pseudomonadales bacterium]